MQNKTVGNRSSIKINRLRRDGMNGRLRHTCPQDEWSFTGCWLLPITNHPHPLLFLRVISQTLCAFQEGLERWEKSATGQSAQWRAQCLESPTPFSSPLQMCGQHWSGVMEWRCGTLNTPEVRHDHHQTRTMKDIKKQKHTHTQWLSGLSFPLTCWCSVTDMTDSTDAKEDRKMIYTGKQKCEKKHLTLWITRWVKDELKDGTCLYHF